MTNNEEDTLKQVGITDVLQFARTFVPFFFLANWHLLANSRKKLKSFPIGAGFTKIRFQDPSAFLVFIS